IHRWYRTRAIDRRGIDGLRVAVCPQAWLWQAGWGGSPAIVAGVQARLAGFVNARHYPGWHLRRRIHAHRGFGGGGGLRAGGGDIHLSPADLGDLVENIASLG